MGSDHASPEYLAGLSDLDRARAIVAVRWCECEWTYTFQRRDGIRYRSLARQTIRLRPADANIPINGNWCAYQPAKKRWGLGWAGSASLMILAEIHGWKLADADAGLPSFTQPNGRFRSEWRLTHEKHENLAVGRGDTIHAAVLLACAAAATTWEDQKKRNQSALERIKLQNGTSEENVCK